MRNPLIDLPLRRPVTWPIREPVTPKQDFWREMGVGMTLCIAAIAQTEDAIVTVSDHMLSSEIMSVDALHATKLAHIGRGPKRWFSLYAGDPTVADQVNEAVHVTLGAASPTFSKIKEAYQRAFRAVLEEKIEDKFLACFGLSLRQFLTKGKDMFGEKEFARRVRVMEQFRLETAFLVGGFMQDGTPMLFSVTDSFDDQQRITNHTAVGFHAVGTGYTLATAALLASYQEAESLDELAYRVLEAKFRGEAASGVGKTTFLCIMTSDGKWRARSDPGLLKIRSFWEGHKLTPIPPDLTNLVQVALREVSFGQAD